MPAISHANSGMARLSARVMAVSFDFVALNHIQNRLFERKHTPELALVVKISIFKILTQVSPSVKLRLYVSTV